MTEPLSSSIIDPVNDSIIKLLTQSLISCQVVQFELQSWLSLIFMFLNMTSQSPATAPGMSEAPPPDERITSMRFCLDHIERCLTDINEFRENFPLQTFETGYLEIMTLVTMARRALWVVTNQGFFEAYRLFSETDQRFVLWEEKWRGENPSAIPPLVGNLNRRFSRYWREEKALYAKNKAIIVLTIEKLKKHETYRWVISVKSDNDITSIISRIEAVFENLSPTEDDVFAVVNMTNSLYDEFEKIIKKIRAYDEEIAVSRAYNNWVLSLDLS